MKKMIRTIEEVSMNAWPALESMLYDGWILRFGKGYTRRANSISPIYQSTQDIDTKIKKCEEIYNSKGLKAIYKITTAVFPENLDSLLENQGYACEAATSVQVLELDNIDNPSNTNLLIDSKLTEEWLGEYCLANSVSGSNKGTLKSILENIIPKHCFLTLKEDGINVAFALGVIENEIIGLFDIVVKKDFRNKGYGKQLVVNLLHYGRQNGAKKAYLQVMLDNPPALSLYSKLGFKEVYKYWYRVK